MAQPILVIGNKNYSSWSLRPWLAARHGGIAIQEQRIPMFVEGYQEAIRSYSPSGRVPALRVGDLTVWDSLAICEYLAELQPSLWPRSQRARAEARAIAAEMHAGFPALRQGMPMNARATGRQVPMTPEMQQEVNRIIAIWQFARARHAAVGPWLFGHYSVADAIYAPVALRFRTYGITAPEGVQGYLHTVLSDPHLQEWLADAAAEPEAIVQYEVG